LLISALAESYEPTSSVRPRLTGSSRTTLFGPNGTTSPWLAGLRLDSFPGPSTSEQLVQAAASIGADVLSPQAVSGDSPVPDPSQPGYIPFTDKPMIDEAHKLGLTVKPWTINRLNIASQLLEWGTDGIITNCRRFDPSRCFYLFSADPLLVNI
jgi:hypothetical protein